MKYFTLFITLFICSSLFTQEKTEKQVTITPHSMGIYLNNIDLFPNDFDPISLTAFYRNRITTRLDAEFQVGINENRISVSQLVDDGTAFFIPRNSFRISSGINWNVAVNKKSEVFMGSNLNYRHTSNTAVIQSTDGNSSTNPVVITQEFLENENRHFNVFSAAFKLGYQYQLTPAIVAGFEFRGELISPYGDFNIDLPGDLRIY